jgi:hypothetical protein
MICLHMLVSKATVKILGGLDGDCKPSLLRPLYCQHDRLEQTAINGGVVGPCCAAVLTFITTHFMLRRICCVKRSSPAPIVRGSSQSNYALKIPLLEAVPLCFYFLMSSAALVW